MSLYLIRHGQTDGNKNRIVQTPDTPLSELGQVQAAKLADALATLPITAILCSDYLRAQQTATPISQALGCDIITNDLLRERNFGDLRGRRYDEIEIDFFAPDYHPVNGESHQMFRARANQSWQWVLQTCSETSGSVAVITHGLLLQHWVKENLRVDQAELALAEFNNTCVTEVSWDDKRTVLRLSDISHLQGLSAAGAIV